jgi:hypothetical protein
MQTVEIYTASVRLPPGRGESHFQKVVQLEDPL